MRTYKLHKLDASPKEEVTVTRDEALKYYREMQASYFIAKSLYFGCQSICNLKSSCITLY